MSDGLLCLESIPTLRTFFVANLDLGSINMAMIWATILDKAPFNELVFKAE